MKTLKQRVLMLSLLTTLTASAQAARVTEQMLQGYQQQGASNFNADAGRALWLSDNNGRDCTQCHGNPLTEAGKHQKTGKVIEPMAPSVNPKRLTDPKHIEKWFLRNCKWTLQRECTPQEKGDILLWLNQQ